jgi:hypothetical protein
MFDCSDCGDRWFGMIDECFGTNKLTTLRAVARYFPKPIKALSGTGGLSVHRSDALENTFSPARKCHTGVERPRLRLVGYCRRENPGPEECADSAEDDFGRKRIEISGQSGRSGRVSLMKGKAA